LLASSGIGGLPTGQGNVVAKTTNIDLYSGDSTDTPFSPNAVTSTGGSQPHTNFQPYLCVNFIISLFGIFPSPT
jgi:microcystin-dependent protein